MKMGRFLWKLAMQSRWRRLNGLGWQAGVAIASLLSLARVNMPMAMAQKLAEPVTAPLAPPAIACPPPALGSLVNQLMLDLPSYSNRVIQRASSLGDDSSLYFLAAGQPDIAQVSIEGLAAASHRSRLPAVHADNADNVALSEEIYQIGFTTLERQYHSSGRPEFPQVSSPSGEPKLTPSTQSFQQFHELILARKLDPVDAPWQIISLRSQLVPYPSGNVVLAPARESRQGSVGRGIALWLRDWQSGSIQAGPTLESNPPEDDPMNPSCMAQ